jgi:hypothetical protein
MNCVDIADAAVNRYQYNHKQLRWTMVAFNAWLKMTINNSFVLWKLLQDDPDNRKITQVKPNFITSTLTHSIQLEFTKKLAAQLSPLSAKRKEAMARSLPEETRPHKRMRTEDHNTTQETIGQCHMFVSEGRGRGKRNLDQNILELVPSVILVRSMFTLLVGKNIVRCSLY